MEYIELAEGLNLSRLIHGFWRMMAWKKSPEEILDLIHFDLDMGITSFDHADIYGDHQCEEAFGRSLHLQPSLRQKIQLITKCGIKLPSKKFPSRTVKFYDYSYDAIITSVNDSLVNFQTDYIDLLLLHRPAPFFEPTEVARAFGELRDSGKVRFFGVSNFSPHQFKMLDYYLDMPLVTNQIELSPYHLDVFHDGNSDFFIRNRIKPMAWSPFAGGRLFSTSDDKSIRILLVLEKLAKKYNTTTSTISLTWMLMHPMQCMPILGTGKKERLQESAGALGFSLELEEWYDIYQAGLGHDIP